jgi:WD40 associated region in TFIID subunit.
MLGGLSNSKSSSNSSKPGQSKEFTELLSSYKKQRAFISKNNQGSGSSSGLNLNSLSLPWESLDSNIVIKTEKDLQLDSRDFGLNTEKEEPIGESVPPKEFFQWYEMKNLHCGEKNSVSFSSMMTDSSSYEEQYLGLKIFLAACSTSYKRELSTILFPLFVHFYLDLVNKSDSNAAQEFYKKFHKDHEENHKDLLQYLPKITIHSQIVQFPIVHELRKSKIVLKLSISVYNYFLQHLRHGNYSLVLQNLNRYFTMRSSSSFISGQCFDDSINDGDEDIDMESYEPFESIRSSSEQNSIDNLKRSIMEMNRCTKLLKPSICVYSIHNTYQGYVSSFFLDLFKL